MGKFKISEARHFWVNGPSLTNVSISECVRNQFSLLKLSGVNFEGDFLPSGSGSDVDYSSLWSLFNSCKSGAPRHHFEDDLLKGNWGPRGTRKRLIQNRSLPGELVASYLNIGGDDIVLFRKGYDHG